jgi:cation diffusion facilitator CzcD-associated flavoprotein CzcO
MYIREAHVTYPVTSTGKAPMSTEDNYYAHLRGSFMFAPNPDWSAFYASGGEIFQYLKKVTTRLNLDKHISFESTVSGATWDEETAKWHFRIRQGPSMEINAQCDILVNAGGMLK